VHLIGRSEVETRQPMTIRENASTTNAT